MGGGGVGGSGIGGLNRTVCRGCMAMSPCTGGQWTHRWGLEAVLPADQWRLTQRLTGGVGCCVRLSPYLLTLSGRRVKYAKHKDTGDEVAIKIMNKSIIKERDFTAQVKHEVRTPLPAVGRQTVLCSRLLVVL